MAAAVLAHEIAHVELKHGMQAIKTSRLTSATSLLASEGAKNMGSSQFHELTNLFGESIQDSVAKLVDTGYSRATEVEADRLAVQFLESSGYQPAALISLLESMDKTGRSAGDIGFFKTHPAPLDRIHEIRVATPNPATSAHPSAINPQRYLAAMKDV